MIDLLLAYADESALAQALAADLSCELAWVQRHGFQRNIRLIDNPENYKGTKTKLVELVRRSHRPNDPSSATRPTGGAS